MEYSDFTNKTVSISYPMEHITWESTSFENSYNESLELLNFNDTLLESEMSYKYKIFLQYYLHQLRLKQKEKPLYNVPWIMVIFLSVLYGAISVTSLAGNGLVVWVVLSCRKMRTVTNLFITNLAVADLIIGLLVVPFHFQAALLQRWNLPEFLCAMCPFFQVLSVNLNVFTLCMIAVDRHRAVMHPLRAKISKRKALIFILGIWMLSLLLAVPIYFDYKVVIAKANLLQPSRKFCHAVVYSGQIRMIYNVGLFAVQYLIPVTIISFTYVRMGAYLWEREIPGNREESRDAVLLKNKKQAIKTLALVVLLFGVCWLPFQVYNFLQYIIPTINHYQYINIIWFCMHWFAMTNCCVNPFVYAVWNERFKQEFRNRISCCRRLGPPVDIRIERDQQQIPLLEAHAQPNCIENENLQIVKPCDTPTASPSNEAKLKLFTENTSFGGNFAAVEKRNELELLPVVKVTVVYLDNAGIRYKTT